MVFVSLDTAMERQKTLEREARCTQDQPPACTAACPVHVDVRGLVAKLRAGDPAGARALYARTIPFPRVVARTCDEPCRAPCRRAEAGGAVAIRALERACVEAGGPFPPPPRPAARKSARVAVVGGGLSGLTAAFDIAAKGYRVALFEAGPRLGGRLASLPEGALPRRDLDADLEVLGALGVAVHLAEPAGGADGPRGLGALLEDFQAVYLATGPGGAAGLATLASDGGAPAVDSQTLATGHPRVFAGGGLVRPPGEPWSPIGSLADGRRAAVSIVRALQGVSLTPAREREGPFATRLFVRVDRAPQPPVTPAVPGAGYDAAEARAEAERCLACECMECVKVCPYLAHHGAYPKRYVREIATNLELKKGDHTANRLVNSCALCGLCEVVCPERLAMGEVCKEARQEMVEHGRMPPSAHDFALRDLVFSRGPAFALARHAPGKTASAAVFFPGCQLAASSPAHVARVYDHLRRSIPGGVALHLGCCGAPADWAGRREVLSEALAETAATWERLGNPRVITACASCDRVFRAQLPRARIEPLWTVLAGAPLARPAGARAPAALAIHDPCAARHDRPAQDAVRALLRGVGVEIVEPALTRERTTCCGYGGLVSYASPAVAEKIVRQRIAESPADFVTYCAMCRDAFAARGKGTWHVLDLLLGDAGDPAAGGLAAPASPGRRGPTLSDRRANRARLKASLLREVWGEDPGAGPARLPLEVPPAVLALMEERLILREDLEATLRHAEETGARLADPASGHLLASHRSGAVTTWVEYSPREAGIVVHATWSHRLEVRPAPAAAPGAGPVAGAAPAPAAPLVCAPCAAPLERVRAVAEYLGFEFPVELDGCRRCGHLHVPEGLAMGKALQVEQLLEDK